MRILKNTNLVYFALSIMLASFNGIAEEHDLSQLPHILNPKNITYLDQNWSEKDRQYFYFTDQGSRLLPYNIFMNLEHADGKKLFRNPENMLRYGFIPVAKSKENPDGLPIGFSRGVNSLGISCAACHTQQIKYRDEYIRIDGGQSMVDLPMFLRELDEAMKRTIEDPETFKRFASRIPGTSLHTAIKVTMKKRLQENYIIRSESNLRNHSEVAYGFSRMDAFGAILNKGLLYTGVKDNFNSANAPTSYPYMWDTPQHDYVEWNGSQSNSNIGALARNIGEVIGVFGEVDPTPKKWLFFFDAGYESSIQASNLRALEKTVSTLHSPLWPESFPAIDQTKVTAGRALYEKHCLSCHLDIDRTDPLRKIQVRMSTLDKIGTDPLMARNALEHRGKTGIFNGRPRFYKVGDAIGEEAPALFIVNNLMIGVLKNNPLQAILAKRDAEKLGHSEVIHPPKYVDGKIIEHGQEVSEHALLAYKARPLNGIWTAGPYLHNGSVPNLYQLLLAAEQRDKSFYIDPWEFDPVNVGYVSTQTPDSFFFDTTLKGNSNAGHEYGTGEYGTDPFTEDEIWALIEYMKTL